MGGNDNQVLTGLLRRLVRVVLAGALPLAATAAFRRGLLAGFLREDRLADSRRKSATTAQIASTAPRAAISQDGFTPQPPVAQI